MTDERTARARMLEPLARARRSAFGRGAVPFWIVLAVLVVALIAAVLLGAFDDADRTPGAVPIGDEVRLSTYAITVLDAEYTDAVEEEFLEAEPGETLLLVTARLENLTDHPAGVGTTADRLSARFINVSDPLLQLVGAEQNSSVSAWRPDGSSGTVILQPGVPTEVTFAWPIPEADAADGVALDVYDVRERHGQIILAADVVTWERTAAAARIELGALS